MLFRKKLLRQLNFKSQSHTVLGLFNNNVPVFHASVISRVNSRSSRRFAVSPKDLCYAVVTLNYAPTAGREGEAAAVNNPNSKTQPHSVQPTLPLAPAHIHPLSGERGSVLSFLALTFSADGTLYAGAKALENAHERLILPEGSYYLAQDIPSGHELEIHGEVSLCLNGKTLERQVHISAGASLALCDCRGKGRISSPGALIVLGRLVMYGGCVENTCPACSPSRCAVVLHGPGSSAELYSGTIKTAGGTGIYSEDTRCELTLSASPRFDGCRADISVHRLRLLPDCAFPNGRLKLSSLTPLAPGQFITLSGPADKDYSHLFTVKQRGYYVSHAHDNSLLLCAAGVVHQPTEHEPRLTVMPPEHALYQWRRATVKDVTDKREFTRQSDFGQHMSTISLLSGDTVSFTPDQSVPDGDVVGLLSMSSGEYIPAQLCDGLANAHVKFDGSYAFVNLSAYFGMERTSSSERMRDVFINPRDFSVQNVAPGHVLAGQLTTVLMPPNPGWYICHVTWPDSFSMDSLPVRIK